MVRRHVTALYQRDCLPPLHPAGADAGFEIGDLHPTGDMPTVGYRGGFFEGWVELAVDHALSIKEVVQRVIAISACVS